MLIINNNNNNNNNSNNNNNNNNSNNNNNCCERSERRHISGAGLPVTVSHSQCPVVSLANAKKRLDVFGWYVCA